MKGTLGISNTRQLQLQLSQVSLFTLQPKTTTTTCTSSAVPRFQNLLDAEAHEDPPSRATVTDDAAAAAADGRDFILSQDFFW